METLTSKKIALFPGCSLEGSSNAFEKSFRIVLRTLGLECEELHDWSCCGATSAHAVSHKLHLALNLRNLALAEEQGFDAILAPCAACYHRLASAEFELRQDADLLAALNAETGLHYGNRVRVRNVLDYLWNGVGGERIAAHVTRPLSGLRVACYYGCLNTRVPRMETFDDRNHPVSMDEIVRALGAEPIRWSYKTECCGASLFISNESVSAMLVAKILHDAVARNADCIAVACPMCQNNLDTKQDQVRKKFEIGRPMPVLFITQLMGLAFGSSESELAVNRSFVPFSLEMARRKE